MLKKIFQKKKFLLNWVLIKINDEKKQKGRISKLNHKRNPLTGHDIELAASYGGKPRGSRMSRIKGQPQRIKRDNTKELFPSLAIENQANEKLSKIVDNMSIKDQDEASDSFKQERNKELRKQLKKLKEEHFRDLDSEELGELNMDLIERKIDDFDYNRQKEYDERLRNHIESSANSGQKPPMFTSNNFYQNRMPFQNSDLLPNSNSRGIMAKNKNNSRMELRSKTKPMNGLKKIYGNLGELVVPADSQEFDRVNRLHSPGSTITLKSGASKQLNRSKFESNSRVKGLEMIYLQKLEKQKKKHPVKRRAKFRTLYNRLIDDPSILAHDENDSDNISVKWIQNYGKGI